MKREKESGGVIMDNCGIGCADDLKYGVPPLAVPPYREPRWAVPPFEGFGLFTSLINGGQNTDSN